MVLLIVKIMNSCFYFIFSVPTSELSQVQWQPFTQESPAYLRVLNENEADNTLEMQFLDPHPQTMAFWENVYEGHFKDAASTWELTGRNDEEEADNEEIAVIDNDNDGETNTTETEEPENEGQTDSASTAVAYTFSIVIIFTVLSQIHSSLILS